MTVDLRNRHLGLLDVLRRLEPTPRPGGQVDVELPADADVLDVLDAAASPSGQPALLFTASPGEGTSTWRVTFVEVGGVLPDRYGRYAGMLIPADPSKLPVAVFYERHHRGGAG